MGYLNKCVHKSHFSTVNNACFITEEPYKCVFTDVHMINNHHLSDYSKNCKIIQSGCKNM